MRTKVSLGQEIGFPTYMDKLEQELAFLLLADVLEQRIAVPEYPFKERDT